MLTGVLLPCREPIAHLHVRSPWRCCTSHTSRLSLPPMAASWQQQLASSSVSRRACMLHLECLPSISDRLNMNLCGHHNMPCWQPMLLHSIQKLCSMMIPRPLLGSTVCPTSCTTSTAHVSLVTVRVTLGLCVDSPLQLRTSTGERPTRPITPIMENQIAPPTSRCPQLTLTCTDLTM
jgi:hypothetical protein